MEIKVYEKEEARREKGKEEKNVERKKSRKRKIEMLEHKRLKVWFSLHRKHTQKQ